FGAYTRTGSDPGRDFGVLSQPNSRQAGSIEPQLRSFLNSVTNKSSYLEFLLVYSGEKNKDTNADPVLFCANPNFPYNLKDFYNSLGR
ncbi:MAG: hypothetical protein ABFQ62_02000, partial [Patescibacteria group bacterium]